MLLCQLVGCNKKIINETALADHKELHHSGQYSSALSPRGSIVRHTAQKTYSNPTTAAAYSTKPCTVTFANEFNPAASPVMATQPNRQQSKRILQCQVACCIRKFMDERALEENRISCRAKYARFTTYGNSISPHRPSDLSQSHDSDCAQ